MKLKISLGLGFCDRCEEKKEDLILIVSTEVLGVCIDCYSSVSNDMKVAFEYLREKNFINGLEKT